MILTEFPIELQEKILGNVKDNTRLNLVCLLWNEICKKDIIKDLRVPCICNKSVFHAMKCKSRNHPCICLNDKESIHYALKCRALEHPCICSNGTPNHSTTCRAITHNCICNIDNYHKMRCKAIEHL
mgnify:FL=1